MAGLTDQTRLVVRPTNIDPQRDSAFSDYASVSVLELVDRAGNEMHVLINTSGTTIDPNADTTYDAAAINSLFIDGPGGKFYVKNTATVWTEVT